jgi:hypothetical protein
MSRSIFESDMKVIERRGAEYADLNAWCLDGSHCGPPRLDGGVL